MQQSRRELLDQFLDFVTEPDDSDARNTAERLLNRVIEGIWLQDDWSEYESPAPYSLTLIAGRRAYAMPDYFGRVSRTGQVRNLTRGTRLLPIEKSELDAVYPAWGTTFETGASPSRYVMLGTSGVYTQPAATGEALEVVSDAGADTAVRVAIGGDDGNGVWTRNEVTLAGLTPVAIGTWSFLDEFGKAYAAGTTPTTELTSSAGTVTLRTVTDSTVLQKLFPQESAREHRLMAFAPTPDAADVIAIPIYRRPKRLWHDADAIPSDWENAIFEEMLIQWRLNTGEITADTASNAPRPQLLNLMTFTNRNRPPRRVRPFGSMR